MVVAQEAVALTANGTVPGAKGEAQGTGGQLKPPHPKSRFGRGVCSAVVGAKRCLGASSTQARKARRNEKTTTTATTTTAKTTAMAFSCNDSRPGCCRLCWWTDGSSGSFRCSRACNCNRRWLTFIVQPYGHTMATEEETAPVVAPRKRLTD